MATIKLDHPVEHAGKTYDAVALEREPEVGDYMVADAAKGEFSKMIYVLSSISGVPVPAFAKIKHWMRQAQKRTIEDTWRHIGLLVSTIQPTECSNYLQKAGYASTKN